jgi:hypothetical protein
MDVKLLTLADLEAAWPIKRETIAAHIKAGRLRAYDFSMCGKGPYGVRPEDAERFLEEHLLIAPAVAVADIEPRPDQHRGRRQAARRTREAHQSRAAAENASYRF